MAIRPMGGEMDEDMFENEEFYEDVGAAEGKDGPLPKFNARKYGNPKELRRAMHQLGDRLRKRLEKLARKEQRALQALAAKKLQALHQIQTRLQTAKQAAGEAQKDAVNTFLQELEDAGQELIAGPKLSGALEDNEAAREAAKEAFRRSVRGAVDIKTHLATLQEIDTEHDVEANRIRARSEAQTAALQTINATLHTTLAKAEADAETAKARLEAKANKAESTIRRAAEKTRNNIKSRLEAIPAYWQAREEAIEYLERQDDPSLEGHLSPGQVEARGRYLAQDEYRNYITRAKHPNTGWFNPSYWRGWRLVGVCVVVAVGLFAVIGETAAFGSLAQGFGVLIGLAVLLGPRLAKVAVFLRGARAVRPRKEK